MRVESANMSKRVKDSEYFLDNESVSGPTSFLSKLKGDAVFATFKFSQCENEDEHDDRWYLQAGYFLHLRLLS